MKTNNRLQPVDFPWELIQPSQHTLFSSLIVAEPVLSAFEDSTNQLWSLVFEDEKRAILKVCPLNGVDGSSFWVGVSTLFGFDYPKSIGHYASVYEQVARLSGLAIPKLFSCESATLEYAGFLFCSMLPGQALTAPVNDCMVEQLAHHLASFHAHASARFGSLFNPQMLGEEWWPRVGGTVELLAKMQGVDLSTLQGADGYQNQQACPNQFVPIMLDLRWDQFLTDSKTLTGLVDLDAFVYGDRALEFVILEYLLTEQQAERFKVEYVKYQAIPDLAQCRSIYRQLLFLMNVLGERSLDTWMRAPQRF